MYNIDWTKFIKRHLRPRLSRPKRVNWLENLTWPIRSLNEAFVSFFQEIKYRADHNGQICYLEHALNDRFDDIDREIYIDNIADQFQNIYLWQKAEAQAPVYLFRKWDSHVDYFIGNHISEGAFVYKALADNIGVQPSTAPLTWEVQPDINVPYLFRKDDETIMDFIVYVPDTLVFDEFEMKALVNSYKTGGKRYKIQTYIP